MKLLLQSFLFLALNVLLLASVHGQMTLMMEKRNSMKVKRLYEGDEIIYRLKGEKNWEKATIWKLIPEENIIVMDRVYIKLEDIAAFKRKRNRRRMKDYSNQIYGGGLTSTGYVINDRPIDWGAVGYLGGSSFILGTMFRTLFKNKIYKFGKRRRLRILDLPPIAPQN